MHHVAASAQQVLEKLFADMNPGTHKKIGQDGGPIMAVVCERLTRTSYSVAHYFKMNGDLVADPDVEFFRGTDGKFYPVAIQQILGYTTAVVHTGAAGHTFDPKIQQDIAEFCTTWMENIRLQQGL